MVPGLAHWLRRYCKFSLGILPIIASIYVAVQFGLNPNLLAPAMSQWPGLIFEILFEGRQLPSPIDRVVPAVVWSGVFALGFSILAAWRGRKHPWPDLLTLYARVALTIAVLFAIGSYLVLPNARWALLPQAVLEQLLDGHLRGRLVPAFITLIFWSGLVAACARFALTLRTIQPRWHALPRVLNAFGHCGLAFALFLAIGDTLAGIDRSVAGWGSWYRVPELFFRSLMTFRSDDPETLQLPVIFLGSLGTLGVAAAASKLVAARANASSFLEALLGTRAAARIYAVLLKMARPILFAVASASHPILYVFRSIRRRATSLRQWSAAAVVVLLFLGALQSAVTGAVSRFFGSTSGSTDAARAPFELLGLRLGDRIDDAVSRLKRDWPQARELFAPEFPSLAGDMHRAFIISYGRLTQRVEFVFDKLDGRIALIAHRTNEPATSQSTIGRATEKHGQPTKQLRAGFPEPYDALWNYKDGAVQGEADVNCLAPVDSERRGGTEVNIQQHCGDVLWIRLSYEQLGSTRSVRVTQYVVYNVPALLAIGFGK